LLGGSSQKNGDSPHRLREGCDVTVITRKTYVDPTLKEYKGVKLVPVNNPRKKSLEAIIHTFRAVLTGRLTGQPLRELYSHAGMFILPSYHEGLPIVLLEAMSYGLSRIVSDIPANRNVDLDGSRYFNPGDIEGMAAKMNEFIDRSLSQEEKHNQVEYIRENFDWEKIAGKTLEVYEKVVSGKW